MKKRVAVILNAENEILLLQRIRHGAEYWVIPGCGMENGDSLTECAIRELKEELECEVHDNQLVFFCELENQGREETYYWCNIAKKHFVISGEEAERSNQDNIYIPTWVQIDELAYINLKPDVLKKLIIKKTQVEDEQQRI